MTVLEDIPVSTNIINVKDTGEECCNMVLDNNRISSSTFSRLPPKRVRSLFNGVFSSYTELYITVADGNEHKSGLLSSCRLAVRKRYETRMITARNSWYRNIKENSLKFAEHIDGNKKCGVVWRSVIDWLRETTETFIRNYHFKYFNPDHPKTTQSNESKTIKRMKKFITILFKF